MLFVISVISELGPRTRAVPKLQNDVRQILLQMPYARTAVGR